MWHPDGLILTNAHVVAGGPVSVTFHDGRTLPADLLARDADLDLAALSVYAAGLPTVALGESRTLRPGQIVLALGHPQGLVGAVTAGVVIGSENGARGPEGAEWITADLHLRPGYSGGPLVDARGRLVGINFMMNGPRVGMAVPVHVVKAFLRRNLGGSRAEAWIGKPRPLPRPRPLSPWGGEARWVGAVYLIQLPLLAGERSSSLQRTLSF